MRYLILYLSGFLFLLGTPLNANNAPCPNITNIALNGTATQSSIHRGAGPERAIDGNTEGSFYHPDESVSSTDYEEEAWWQLDLGAINDISEIRVWNQTGGNSISDFYVFISDTPLSPDINVNLNNPAVYNEFHAGDAGSPTFFPLTVTGRYIQIQGSDWGFVTLAEVEVMGCSNGNGNDTTPPSVTLSAPNPVDNDFTLTINFSEPVIDFDLNDIAIINGLAYNLTGSAYSFTLDISPAGDLVTLYIPANQVTDPSGNGNTVSNELRITYTPPTSGGNGLNVALNKPAMQSNDRHSYSTADKAVDGNTNGSYYHPDQSVSSTTYGEDRWWEVDLLQVYDLSEIQLFNQTGGNSTEDFYLFVSDVPFTSYDLNTTLNQSGVFNVYTDGDMGSPTTIPINRSGRYVRVQVDGWGFNTLAEVEVYETDVPEPVGPDENTYAQLKKKLDGGFVTFPDEDVYFKYVEQYAITSGENDLLRLNIYDKQRDLKTTGTLANNYGVNWFKFSPKPILPDEYYILEVTGGNKGEKYYLRFTYD